MDRALGDGDHPREESLQIDLNGDVVGQTLRSFRTSGANVEEQALPERQGGNERLVGIVELLLGSQGVGLQLVSSRLRLGQDLALESSDL